MTTDERREAIDNERKEALCMPSPKTTREAVRAFDKLARYMGNGEELSFDINSLDKGAANIIRIALDLRNEMISVMNFYWCEDEYDKAIECINCNALTKEDATRMADILKYFVKILNEKGGEE